MANLVRHVRASDYYARIHVRGKLIWESLKTDRIIQICNGNGYCLQAQKSSALDVNTVILLSNQSEAIIRASQLGILSFHVYNVAPAKINGCKIYPKGNRAFQ